MFHIKKSLKLILILFLLFGTLSGVFADWEGSDEIPGHQSGMRNLLDDAISPCDDPEREPRFIYREKVLEEERQFRAEHPGCGGNIMMRKEQIVALEAGYCGDGGHRDDIPDCDEDTDNIIWLGDVIGEDAYIHIYERHIPESEGRLFEEVGSWQKPWPGDTDWKTEEELEEDYGEPIPFPTCQNDCLQAPPGTPQEAGEYGQEDPYYLNNPHLPEMMGGEEALAADPDLMEEFREEKNVLGGDDDALDRVPLPTKLFWWNVPGWQDGWIEDGEFQKCEQNLEGVPEDDPEEIACVHSYKINFDNINREDRPPELYRHEVVYEIREMIEDELGTSSEEAYLRAQKIYEDLERGFRESYEEYRRAKNDYRTVDGPMRYDRDNILGCDECGAEKEIWLESNTFNPLKYDPLIDYEREHRNWMLSYMLNDYNYQELDEDIPEEEDLLEAIQGEIITEAFTRYGRPAFFRSDTEHSFELQAQCAPHDYLEEEEGRWGPDATYSFETSDGPELISPLDPNWVSPYEPKTYDPNHDRGRVIHDIDDQDESPYKEKREDGYSYPEERIDGSSLEEEENVSDYEPDDNLWEELWEETESLIFQDQVPFREELEWSQIWFRPSPDRSGIRNAFPARLYRVSLGEGYKVYDNLGKENHPIREYCHPQHRETYRERPICNYLKRTEAPFVDGHNYPMPFHEDRNFEYFFLPEEDDEDVYSWSVAACRDQAESYCTNYSQMWRFQVDQNEEMRIFPPRGLNPPNWHQEREIMNDEEAWDEATAGFPFAIDWDRHFGAETYVFRLREAQGSSGNWLTDWDPTNHDDAIDARVQREDGVRYLLDDLNIKPGTDDEILDPDTKYEWDVKACWDDAIHHEEEDPSEILEWVYDSGKHENCSQWRSQTHPDEAPFLFKTIGEEPEFDSSTTFPIYTDGAEYPLEFTWTEAPAAKGYGFLLCLDDCDDLPPYESPSPGLPATVGTFTADLETTLYRSLQLGETYNWIIYPCSKAPTEDDVKYYPEVPGPYFPEPENNLEDWTDKAVKLGCNIRPTSLANLHSMHFMPRIDPPQGLTPGVSESQFNDPDGFRDYITPEDSVRTISWKAIEGVDYYQVSIESVSGPATLLSSAYAQVGDFPVTVDESMFTYDFSELGEGSYKIQVRGCLEWDPENEECEPEYLADIDNAAERFVIYTTEGPEQDGIVRGVIPCGTDRDLEYVEGYDTTEDCQPHHLFVLFKLLIEEILIKLLIPFSLIALITYTGVVYYTSMGKPETTQKVLKLWKAALKGYLLIFLSWWIVGTILTLIGYRVGVFGEWWEIIID